MLVQNCTTFHKKIVHLFCTPPKSLESWCVMRASEKSETESDLLKTGFIVKPV
ncbi:uncharacterized protein METZ01_LOCUS458085 [marine metagenome]|uniref:Uncharacterized protein n=1 Tax=marine metagenome TaxID=408172 RepID=A0A383AC78_9ZZZZ